MAQSDIRYRPFRVRHKSSQSLTGLAFTGALLLAMISGLATSSAASVHTCRIFTEKGIHASAIQACSAVIEAAGSRPATRAEALFYRANSYYSTRDIESAIDDINASLGLRPDYGPAIVLHAALKAHSGNMAAAAADLDRAIALGQDSADVRSRRATARLATGDLQGAADDLIAVVAAAPRDAIAHLRLAITLNELGRNGPAMEAADRAIALNRDYSDAYGVRAKIKSEIDDLEGALEDFARAATRAGEGIRHLIGKADLLARAGRSDQALSAVEAALSIAPADRTAQVLKADILQNSGRIPEARAALAGLASTDPAIAIRRARLGIASNDLAGATADYTNALTLDPTLTAAYFERGQILASRGKWVAAITDFDQVIAADTGYADRRLHYLRGKAKFRTGNYEGAVADFSRDLTIAETADGLLWRALAYSELGEFTSGLADAARLITVAPGKARAHAVLGDVLLKAGRLSDGKKAHERALALDPEFAPSLQRMEELAGV